MAAKIALYGGNFNPPGVHHYKIIQELLRHFDKVLVIPCGPRPDKEIVNNVEPIYRATMTDLALQGLERVEIDLFDLEQATFTRAYALEERFSHLGEIWHVVGTDLIEPDREGQSKIQTSWARGDTLWKQSRFAVITRPGHEVYEKNLPPKHRLFSIDIRGSSAEIREKLFQGEDCSTLINPKVLSYIRRRGLYRGSLPRQKTIVNLKDDLRVLLSVDERNPKAVEWAKEFAPYHTPENPNCILVFGGDGSMLHAIQKYWRLRVPFFGINAGHLGFLLNNPKDTLEGLFPKNDVILRQLPLLYVEMQSLDGQWKNMLSFNDAWIERSTGQTAWVEMKINQQTRIEKLVCDGVLVSTAAGSTAYARAMGAAPILADSQAWLVVGSNVMYPPKWKSAMLSIDAEIEVSLLDTKKRPMLGYVYGVPMGEVQKMRARMSRIAGVELGFLAHHGLAEKIAQIQFSQ